MHIEDFAGQGASVQSLCEAFASGAPPHASLLLGQAGVGKRTMANTLAQSLFCTGMPPKPCGTCPGCKRFLAGSHPDVHRIHAAKKIGVEDIRALIGSLSTAPYEGGWRVALIESAGVMTPQAQNSLLKTLEEPPVRTVFLLTAVSISQLLPTIVSRCRIVQVPSMPQARVVQLLTERGLTMDRATELASLSQGSIGEALSMDADASFWALRTKVYQAMASIHGPGDVLAAVNALKDDKADAGRICDLLEGVLREALVASLAGKATQKTVWTAALSAATPQGLTALLEKITLMRRMLASNVSWQAAVERFLLYYAEETRKWQS